MRPYGTPTELEHRRLLAIRKVLAEGFTPAEVAEFLEVDSASVRRWLSAFREHGLKGVTARPVAGRPTKLTLTQEKIILRWLLDCPTEHGFATDLWTSGRLAQLIEQEFGVQFNPDYLSTWLRARGFTPQMPKRVPRERDPKAIAEWVEHEWPRIKKKRRRRELA